MRARLFSRYGKLGRLDFEIGEEATIGRSQSNSIVLAARAISNQHARIRLDRERDRYVLEDLGSLNGTELDGVRLAGPEPLDRLHVVTVAGRYDFVFLDRGAVRPHRRAEAGAAEAEETPPPRRAAPTGGDTMLEKAPVALPAGLDGGAKPGMGTVVEAGPVVLPAGLGEEVPAAPRDPGEEERPAASAGEPQQRSFLLELPEDLGAHALPRQPGENVVGRTREADVSIPRPTVSRRHAILRVEGERVWIRDLESANRTYVDEVRLEPGTEVEVVSGARLRFGDVEGRLHLRGSGDEAAPGAGSGGAAGEEDGDD